MRVGIAVYCSVCHRRKAPHGRSVPYALAGSLCSEDMAEFECEGYRQEPLPGCLWPGETEEDFGYTICGHATEEKQ